MTTPTPACVVSAHNGDGPALYTVTLGCVHEHVSAGPMCADCWERTRVYIATGFMICAPCWATGHRCTPHATAVHLTPPTTPWHDGTPTP